MTVTLQRNPDPVPRQGRAIGKARRRAAEQDRRRHHGTQVSPASTARNRSRRPFQRIRSPRLPADPWVRIMDALRTDATGEGMKKRIAVVGAGAVGGYVGGHLARNGADVTLIDPWPEHNGFIVAKGAEVGLAAPTHARLTATVRQVQQGELPPRPENLYGV